MGNPAITVSGVGKTFVLPHEKRETMREWVASGFRRMSYDRFDALRDVSFEVEPGSCFGIIGRNGSGKSTLLKILAGIFPPNTGSVAVRGRISPFLELGVGFNPDLSARDNVYLNAAVLGLRRSEIDACFDEIIAFAELERFVDQKLKNFSSGMHVRLAFAVAIKAQADVYLMDEVLAVGDLAFQQKCFDVFRRFRSEGRTIVLVSHDLASIRNYCERTLYLKDGEVVALGPTVEVLDRYVYEDRVVVLPPGPLGTDAAGIRSPVRVTGARVLDHAGRPQRQLMSGDAMAIDIDYAADAGAANLVLELTLADPRGTVLFTVDSAAFDLRPAAAEGTLRVRFPNPAIGEGHVVVSAAARSRDGTLFHRRDRIGEFDVLAGPDTRGLLRMPVSAAFVSPPDH